ncbi:hypothetical protein HRTV-11_gp91 [Halorubrum virus HRTV-11]|nr:hypothetical protein HRTV-11_gp91 [Halorubrum virus HRTV-11]
MIHPDEVGKQVIPIDRSRRFHPSDYPHQPEAYHVCSHFRQRMKESERFLDGEVIARCIVEGDLKDNGDGCAAFSWTRNGDGVEYWFLAGFHLDGYRIAVTAWPYLRDRQKALKSGWIDDELDTIEAFNKKSRNYRRFSEEWAEYVNWSKRHA